MRKIRSDVDLKELEKFGYKLRTYSDSPRTEYKKWIDDMEKSLESFWDNIVIDTQTREVHCFRFKHEIKRFQHRHWWFTNNINQLKEAGLLEEN